jgi:glycosyltransferase involved in cell wall biosynthesis
MKLCVFPNDPIIAYYNKGEIKEGYFNPEGKFDEIHIVSLIDQDIEEEKVQKLVGNARLKIHSVGKINIINRKKHSKRIINLVKKINPDVIRAYNPFVEGWLAAICKNKLGIPLFVSLHTQYDYNRNLAKSTNLKKFLALKYSEKFIEPFVLNSADKITIVFKIIESYVIKHTKKKPEVLYNKIDYDRFSNAIPLDNIKRPLILSVGNLIKEKNHKLIIESMKKIDANYLIIGNGPLYDELYQIIKKLNLTNRISIIKSVPHGEIHRYFKSADIFALAYDMNQEGLPMTVMEAMAAGLPVIIPFPKEGFSDGLDDVAIFSERDVDSFGKKIKMLLNDTELRKKYSEKSQKKALDYDISKIEKREAEIYEELIRQRRSSSQNTNC